jgi:putative ABC transport system substrate-binding protein
MNRREFMFFLGGAMTAARALRAQPKPMPVIGYLTTGSASSRTLAPNLAAFRQGLSDIGYVEGQNVAIEYRWAEGQYDRLPALAADLVGRKVEVIATSGGPMPVRAAKSATSTIPIVFMGTSDPVGNGLVASLARPGGNITGISPMQTELMAKRLDLLSDLVPQARVIALLVATESQTERVIGDVQEAARAKGAELAIVRAGTESEIDTAFASLAQLHADALVVAADPFLGGRRDQLVALASRHAVPAIYSWREFASAGGLISYGSSIADNFRQAGIYVGRILKGEKPADLPVQQPTIFELVINLNTAKVLGISVPPSILARADEVIE